MKLEIHHITLPLKKTFTISRGSISMQGSIIVELHEQGAVGLGEATQSGYYAKTTASIATSLLRLEPELAKQEFTTPEALWDFALPRLSGDMFALSALDQAAHDLHGKLTRTSVFQRHGLTWTNIPASSITISIDEIPRMLEELGCYRDWPIVKVKLGTQKDLEIMRALRQRSDAVFRVDANCAWTPEETVSNSKALAELGVEFIEQPLSADAPEREKRRVFEESALPIIADESCQLETDVKQCAGFFHGINVKLCKCGGLTPAFRMITEAKALGMKTMVGCMIESDVAISAAAQLLPVLDFADLDGSALLAEQPARGIQPKRGIIATPVGYGCGVIFNP